MVDTDKIHEAIDLLLDTDYDLIHVDGSLLEQLHSLLETVLVEQDLMRDTNGPWDDFGGSDE